MSANVVTSTDERLAALFRGQPATEDAYIYKSNGPHHANGSAVPAASD